MWQNCIVGQIPCIIGWSLKFTNLLQLTLLNVDSR